jgi:hypothetical protein
MLVIIIALTKNYIHFFKSKPTPYSSHKKGGKPNFLDFV